MLCSSPHSTSVKYSLPLTADLCHSELVPSTPSLHNPQLAKMSKSWLTSPNASYNLSAQSYVSETTSFTAC